MNGLLQNKYAFGKLIELLKFCFTLSLLAFLLIKAPGQAAQIVTMAGAFVLGGSKFKTQLGL